MRDVLTHAVVAVSVSLENNSFLGYTNLFLNLGEDKKEFCAKYDIDLNDERLFPSNFLPLDFYSDRGSDYKSDPAEKLCNALGINRHIVTGGSGSMKGMIEQWFHQIHTMVNPYIHTQRVPGRSRKGTTPSITSRLFLRFMISQRCC